MSVDRHGVLHDALGLPELRNDEKYVCLCGQGFESLTLLGDHIGDAKVEVRDRRDAVDRLLKRLLDTERQIIHYQQMADGIRYEILDRLAGGPGDGERDR